MVLPQQKHLSQGSCWVLFLGDPHPGVCVACQDACSPPVSLVLPTLYSSWLTGGSRAEEVHCDLCVWLSLPPDALFPFLVSASYGGLCGALGYGYWCAWIGGLWVWLLIWVSPFWLFLCLSLWVNLFFFLLVFLL